MTHQTVTHSDSKAGAGAAMLSILGAGALTLLWGAYTLLIVVEIGMLGTP
ncbi:MAG TPA: hypothetical protein PLK37_05595 [Terricaulis sp.]|nr:hypothetical protein [Terricaulis sp.]